MKLDKVTVKINVGSEIGFLKLLGISGSIELCWGVTKVQQLAAWELYVELVTRITTVELKQNEGLIREALSSLYSLFNITRDILRRYGPRVTKPLSRDKLSFGYIAVLVLNKLLRPFLAKWHPLLTDYENNRSNNVSQFKHEQNWENNNKIRDELNDELRGPLNQYASLLSKMAGIPEVHEMTS